MYPHDPEYVAEMSKPGFDEHLDLALHAGKADYEEVELYKQHKDADDLGGNLATLVKTVAKIRKKFKPVNYSATYGVGKVKLSRTTGMSEGECGELIEAYWDRNWSVKVVADSLTVRTIGGKMWLYNPVSRFWISLRYDKDRFSSLNQSTGVFCFDSWLAQLWTRGVKGCFQAHDEILIPTKNKVATEEALKWAIGRVNEKLQLNVLLDVDSKYGDSYAAVH
jgi:hypothetical protein